MASGEPGDAGRDRDTREWAMWLHLSLLSGYVVPLAGLIAPIAIWRVKRRDLPGLEPHGRNVANWLLSALIYSIVCALLTVVGIGLLGFAALAVCAVAFPIIAAIKARDGDVWRYPLTIGFLRGPEEDELSA